MNHLKSLNFTTVTTRGAANPILNRRANLIARLEDQLGRLPEDLRVAFVMCDVEGVAGVEAARVLGLREGTLWRRLHFARKALRAALEEGNHERH